MFVCDESVQPEQIDLSVKWLKRWRGGGGAAGEVEQETQVIVSLGVEVDPSVIWQNRKRKKKNTKLPPLIPSYCWLSAGKRKGKYWPNVVWFLLLREWMSSNIPIRDTLLLVILPLPILQRLPQTQECEECGFYLFFLPVWKCTNL